MSNRDIVILKKVVQYSNDIDETIIRFELNSDKFKSDRIAKNAISMCILQIGESAGKLTDEFKSEYNKMPWRDIISIRNRAAHAYESVDMEILWNIAVTNVPELKMYCKTVISEMDRGQ